MSPGCRKTDLNAPSLETVSRAAFHGAAACARVGVVVGGGQAIYAWKWTKGNYWILDVKRKKEKKEMSGEELFIRSCPCALKLKLKYKEGNAWKGKLLERKMDKWVRSFLRSSLKRGATHWNTQACYLGLGVKWRADYILPHNNIN